MTRSTSREAYEHLIKTGALKGNQALVLDQLIHCGPCTSGELLDRMKVENVNAWRARFTELQAKGLIVESGSRACKITGRRAIVWTATDRMKPLDVKKGHRIDGRAWKALAETAISELMARGHTTAASKLRAKADAL